MLKKCIICGQVFDARGPAKTCGVVCSKARAKACEHAYKQRPDHKERRLERDRSRAKSDDQKARRRAYYQTPQRQAYLRAYRRTPENKARHRAYQQRPEWKAYERAYQQTPQRQAYLRSYKQTNRIIRLAAFADAVKIAATKEAAQ